MQAFLPAGKGASCPSIHPSNVSASMRSTRYLADISTYGGHAARQRPACCSAPSQLTHMVVGSSPVFVSVFVFIFMFYLLLSVCQLFFLFLFLRLFFFPCFLVGFSHGLLPAFD
ncbi:hypothetical protein F4861DRAFT_416621 [Xylaria intraflava]|nr:hypothetical protein F4861DRAFT_416621 [Xylaria intraflava]